MILSIFIFVLATLCLLFSVKTKRLNILEIVTIWMLVCIITHTFNSLIVVNLQYLSTSQNLSLFWASVLKRMILCPLIIIWSFDLILMSISKLMIGIQLILTIFVLILNQYIFIWIGVLHNNHWNVFYSFIEWSFCTFIAYLFWIWYRKQLRKGT